MEVIENGIGGLKCVKRRHSEINGKQHVYLIGLNDTKSWQYISESILKIVDCGIWFHEHISKYTCDEIEKSLIKMQLIVVIVTKDLLINHKKDVETVISISKKHMIPLIPILAEDIRGQYDALFGNAQYLSIYENDNTVLPFSEKLSKYLKNVLIPDEIIERIQSQFRKNIFISYRKKDRIEVLKMIQLIHENDCFIDVSIWYDEDLIPGEDFTKGIESAIDDCDVVLVVITPLLLETPNYVISTEIPLAENKQKTIIAIETQAVDKDKYNKAEISVPLLKVSALPEILMDNLGVDREDSPLHTYYIGLAYLNGISVEVNVERALKLIRKSAEQGVIDALLKLVSVYIYGQGVKPDARIALQWQLKILGLAKKQYGLPNSYEKSYYQYIDALRMTGRLYREIGDVPKADLYFNEMLSILNDIEMASKDRPLIELWKLVELKEIADIYCDLGRNKIAISKSESISLYKKAIEYYSVSTWGDSEFQIAKCKSIIGWLCFQTDNVEDAYIYTIDAYRYFSKEDIFNEIVAFEKAHVALNLAHIENAKQCKTSSLKYALEASALLEEIYYDTDDRGCLDPWFDAELLLVGLYSDSMDSDIFIHCSKLLDITIKMDESFDYVNENGTSIEEKLRESQAIAYYYCAITSGIANDENAAEEFLIESQFALWKLQELSPGKYDDRLHEVEELLSRLNKKSE